jgi:hypothetical protein
VIGFVMGFCPGQLIEIPWGEEGWSKTRVFGTDELRFCGQIWRYFEMRML